MTTQPYVHCPRYIPAKRVHPDVCLDHFRKNDEECVKANCLYWHQYLKRGYEPVNKKVKDIEY